MKNKILFFYIIINMFSCNIWSQKKLSGDTINLLVKKVKYYHVEETVSQRFGGNKRVYNVTYENLISTYDLGPNGIRTVTPVFVGEEEQQITKTNKKEKRTITPLLEEEEQEEQPQQLAKTNKNKKRTITPVLEEEQERQFTKTAKNTTRFITSLFKVIKAKEEQNRQFTRTIKKSEISKKEALKTPSKKTQQDKQSNNLNDFNKIEEPDKLSATETAQEESYSTYTFNVIEIYENVVNDGYESVEILTTVGDSYYFKKDFKNAQKYYEKLFKNFINDVEPEYYYRYSIALRSENKIKTADLYLKKYNELKSKRNS